MLLALSIFKLRKVDSSVKRSSISAVAPSLLIAVHPAIFKLVSFGIFSTTAAKQSLFMHNVSAKSKTTKDGCVNIDSLAWFTNRLVISFLPLTKVVDVEVRLTAPLTPPLRPEEPFETLLLNVANDEKPLLPGIRKSIIE
uniref:Uncharacterized protein n=1 Tax=Glossina austeni TaxID=7395 RepID=A0A1A9VXJ5_GLOAU